MATSPCHNNDNVGNASSASTSSSNFEVFLSFCGKDTRKGFTDFLYTYLDGASIRTFRDDNELRVGEEIGPELLKAIKESKISIPIFSKNYASSKWCLLELAQMVECHTTQGQIIFPIFYDVNPRDVRNQSGSYEEAFRQHKKRCFDEKTKRFDEKTVKDWKEALRKVGELKGLELNNETQGHEGKLVKMIVEKVLTLLKKNYKYELKNLVGMDIHIEMMKGLLNVDSNGFRVIGIYGMGGLGKTTIAKAIYNQLCELFECHCFLEDVRENSKNRNGIVRLQNQLLSKILKTKISKIDDANEGVNKIKDAVRGKKAFIVLDDVDDMSQINKLAGSYEWFNARIRIIITTRNKHVLHALEKTYESEGQFEVYRSYKPEFMDDDHSLLLFSKYAFKRDSPPKEYDSLSKEVVSTTAGLPLALVTIGSSLFGEGIDLWEERLSKLKEIPDEDVLKKLRLSFDPLAERQKQIFLDIACLFIGEDKGNPCYMWDDCKFYPKDGLNDLVRRSLITVGDDNILKMHDQLRDLGRQIAWEGNSNELGRWSRLCNKDEALAMFKTLQGTENFKALHIWDQTASIWDQTASSSPLVLRGEDLRNKLPNLRYLTLGYNTELDGDFEHCLPNLRWLRWHRFLGQDSTPINLHLKNLVILELKHSEITDEWEGWRQFKMSKKLKVLNLSWSNALTRVPYLSTFSTLERLHVSLCSSLCSLDGIEELQSLRYMDASFCFSLERLSNLSKLSKLEELHVSRCQNLTEIQGLDKLVSLKLLGMRYCTSLERLPNLSNLKKLKTLDASNCSKLIGIQGLDKLGGSLEILDISECKSLQRIPNLSNLKRLRELKTQGCFKLIEILGLEGLESLENLDMKAGGSIKGLLDLSNLKSLKTLNVSYCRELTEIQGLDRLGSLELLDMHGCRSIKRLSDLSNLKSLKTLNVSSWDELIEIHGLEGLESLENLYMHGCRSIKRLSDLSNLKSLKKLNVSSCKELIEIQGLDKLGGSLELLEIIECESLQRIPNLSNLKRLRELKTQDCFKLIEIHGLEGLESLENLDMKACGSIKRLLDLSNLKSLKSLNVSYCHELTEIQGLQRLESLEHLKISRCISIERLPDLPNSGMLKHIDLSYCSMLSEVEGLRVVESLESLNLSFCESLGQIPDLTNFKNLKELDIRFLPELNEIRGLEELKSLERLYIGGCNSIQNLSDFSNLKKLQVIDATGCKKLTEIRGLEKLESLKNLYIRGCKSLENLPYLPNTTIHKDYYVFGFMGCKDCGVEGFMYSGGCYIYRSIEEADNYSSE